MSIWKRGTNLVKGMIAEASKSDDPEKMNALEKELEETAQKQSRPKPSLEETLQKASKAQDKEESSEETPEEKEQEIAPPDPDKPLTPKKRTI